VGEGLLVVNTSASWGGNEHWAVRVAAGMAERGHRVGFAWAHPVVGERVAAAGLDGVRCAMRGDLHLAAAWRLHGELRRLDARAVLLTKWREYLLGGLAARLARGPRAVMGLGLKVIPRDDPKRRFIFALADRVLVNAPEIRDTLAATGWIPAAKVAVVVNGLDLAWHRPRWEPDLAEAGRRLRTQFGIPPEAPLLVNVGSLTPQKDQANLLRAAARLRVTHPDLRVLILGEGSLRPSLERLVASSGLGDAVHLPGFLADVRPALAAADLFVLASDNEGMAWVLMEAAAAGLPAVTTDVSGARACVEDGATGAVVPPRDDAALAAAIANLLASPQGAEMGRAARRLAESRFDERRMLDETEIILFS
jgi:glycosyltransferase involved in cell wall biosynthesis